MLDEHVELLERSLVEQQLDALARGQFAASMLRLDALLAAAEFRARAPFLEGVQDVLHAFPPVLHKSIFSGSNRPFGKPKAGFGRHLALQGMPNQGLISGSSANG